MSKSPGHRQHPEHKVLESRVPHTMKVEVDGVTVAQSDDVVRVDEDQAPARYYFPRSDVRMEMLTPSRVTSDCPFKGHATYFDLKAGAKPLEGAVWTYESPYDEHLALRQRVAFYDDKYPQIRVQGG